MTPDPPGSVELVLAPVADPLVRLGYRGRDPDARLKLVLKAALRQHGWRLVRMRPAPAAASACEVGDEVSRPGDAPAEGEARRVRRPPGRLC